MAVGFLFGIALKNFGEATSQVETPFNLQLSGKDLKKNKNFNLKA